MRFLILILQLVFWPGCSAPPPTSVDPRPEPELADANDLRLVVTVFSAPWCGPCRNHKPYLLKLEGETKGVDYVHVNIDKEQKKSQRWGISSIPTYVVHYAAEEIYRTHDIHKLVKLVENFENP